MTGNEKFRLKVVDDLRKNRVIVESDEEYIALLKKANKDLGDLVRERDAKLAASQAHIKVLREALEESREFFETPTDRRNIQPYVQVCNALSAPNDDSALQAATSEYKQDAERYRWLRDNDWDSDLADSIGLDAAIDKARGTK